jgi:hypothetical protein
MCDRHNDELGYLCNECFSDFIDYLISVHWQCEDGSLYRYAKAFLQHPKKFKFTDRDAVILAATKTANDLFPMDKFIDWSERDR